MKLVGRVIATFFGLGFFPFAPGTAASLAVVLLYKFLLAPLPWPYILVFLFLLGILGVVSSGFYSSELGEKDPRTIVIDEACGQLLALILVPPTWIALGLSFVLFRFFDIVKPWPITKAEKLPRGWGIMADDLVAAAISLIILQVYLYLK
jgi:phosphatidylglycerophosphatase A